MNRIDLIIDALESAYEDKAGWCDKVNEALYAARELQALKSEANVWNDDSVSMPLNKFCRAWVNWSSYSTDGDSTQHGRAEAIVLKYKRNPDEEAFTFIHRGHKQYLHESFDIIKWQLLDPKPTRKKDTK
jgi:hypothetical protein